MQLATTRSFFFADAEILEGPHNTTVPIGANATFRCIAEVEFFAYWKINNRTIDDRQNITRLTEEGFKFNEISLRNLTMSINAMPQYNNTMIICVAQSLTDHKHCSSTPAKLTVIGTYTQFQPHGCMVSLTQQATCINHTVAVQYSQLCSIKNLGL